MNRLLRTLLRKTNSNEFWPEFYVGAVRLVDKLQLRSRARELVALRLENARACAGVAKHRAAAFELWMLRRELG